MLQQSTTAKYKYFCGTHFSLDKCKSREYIDEKLLGGTAMSGYMTFGMNNVSMQFVPVNPWQTGLALPYSYLGN